MGKRNFKSLYRRLQRQRGTVTCEISGHSDNFNPSRNYAGVIIYSVDGRFDWENRGSHSGLQRGRSTGSYEKSLVPYGYCEGSRVNSAGSYEYRETPRVYSPEPCGYYEDRYGYKVESYGYKVEPYGYKVEPYGYKVGPSVCNERRYCYSAEPYGYYEKPYEYYERPYEYYEGPYDYYERPYSYSVEPYGYSSGSYEYSGSFNGNRGRSFYIIIQCTDDWPTDYYRPIGQGTVHDYLLKTVVGMESEQKRISCGGFAYLFGDLRFSSIWLNATDQVDGETDGSRHMSDPETALTTYCWEQYKRRGANQVFSIPAYLEQQLMY